MTTTVHPFKPHKFSVWHIWWTLICLNIVRPCDLDIWPYNLLMVWSIYHGKHTYHIRTFIDLSFLSYKRARDTWTDRQANERRAMRNAIPWLEGRQYNVEQMARSADWLFQHYLVLLISHEVSLSHYVSHYLYCCRLCHPLFVARASVGRQMFAAAYMNHHSPWNCKNNKQFLSYVV